MKATLKLNSAQLPTTSCQNNLQVHTWLSTLNY
ncbi:hypothetical protein CfE428DRAFT_4488 [Chthoniobacter flavus Ellin428]|uniref:Uncharacterized protein n=1 Tax=Chthoniobacter flavus Ellin428 TaxID=497964 RepID=B4D6E8_9BACT|nr:hypothetical protein CfE428DRAFT_4488 [Chthoniobacter flavus Ellin428]TCO88298.1 hypothetical protein EV701_11895 [Chthoniobacter flavus]